MEGPVVRSGVPSGVVIVFGDMGTSWIDWIDDEHGRRTFRKKKAGIESGGEVAGIGKT